jgi:hypothetical protein
MGRDSGTRRTAAHALASIAIVLIGAFWSRDVRAASIEVTESPPGTFHIEVTTDVVFDTLIVGVNGDVADGVNLVPIHEQLGSRQIVSTSNGFRLLSPLGSPESVGVIQPGISHDIELTYGVTNPVPGEWIDGLDSVPFLGFRLVSGPGDAHAQFLYRGATVDEATQDIHLVDIPGDYNHNGLVDAADYVVWRHTLGQTGPGLAADGDGNQQIDASDYTVWKMSFGEATGGSGLVHVPVPEPATSLMLIVAIAAIRCRRHATVDAPARTR